VDLKSAVQGTVFTIRLTFRLLLGAAAVLLMVGGLLIIEPFGYPVLGVPLAAAGLFAAFAAAF